MTRRALRAGRLGTAANDRCGECILWVIDEAGEAGFAVVTSDWPGRGAAWGLWNRPAAGGQCGSLYEPCRDVPPAELETA